MWELILATAVIAAGPTVEVETLDGRKVHGELKALADDKAIVVSSSTEETSLSFQELLQITLRNDNQPDLSATRFVHVELIDQTRIKTTQFTESGGTATLTAEEQQIRIPAKAIRSVRFRPPAESVAQQWNSIAAQNASGDILVLRQENNTLDFFEGTVQGVTSDNVKFTFDGTDLDVERGRLEGCIYYQIDQREWPNAKCQISDYDGNVWHAEKVWTKEQHVHLRTLAGVNHSMPIERMVKLDFSRGNLLYLSDIEPVQVKWSPYFASRLVSNYLEQMFLPRRDHSFGGKPLRLRFSDGVPHVEEYAKGLAIHSRTEMLYRLPNGFRRFVALVGIDEEVRQVGYTKIVISGDGELLFESAISGDEGPRTVDVPIQGVRRLKILVDFGDDLAMANQLDLCNARIIK